MSKDRAKDRAWYKERYKRYKADHKCVSCGCQDERTLSGKPVCAKCLAKQSMSYQARKQRYAEQGLCMCCGKPNDRAESGKIYCTECGARRTLREEARQKRLYEHRLCMTCGKPLPDGYFFVNCVSCRDKKKQKYRDKKEGLTS